MGGGGNGVGEGAESPGVPRGSFASPPTINAEDLPFLIRSAQCVHCSLPVKGFIRELVQRVRLQRFVALGPGPRCPGKLERLAKAVALLCGMPYSVPAHVAEVAVEALAHQIHRVKVDNLNLTPFANDGGDETRRPRYPNGGGASRGASSGNAGSEAHAQTNTTAPLPVDYEAVDRNDGEDSLNNDPVMGWFRDMELNGVIPKRHEEEEWAGGEDGGGGGARQQSGTGEFADAAHDDVTWEERSFIVPGMPHRRRIVKLVLAACSPKL